MEKKKSLGQHFLHAPSYLSLIADTAALKRGEHVLEVGPGDGALTQELLSREVTVHAVEKDRRLISPLTEKFSREIKEKKLFVYEGDILTFSPHHLGLYDISYKIVANIPYYITGALIKKFLTSKEQPESMTLLVQKEVAQRIARSKKESLLSLSIKAYGRPRYVKTFPRGAFSPPPDVDSAILLIENISRERFIKKGHEERFFELVRAGFAQKRKLLKRNLEKILQNEAGKSLEQAGIPQNARAEDVAIEQWLLLSKL